MMGIPSLKYSANYYSSTSIDNIGMCIPINVAKPLITKALEAYDGEAVQKQLEEKAKNEKVDILDPSQRPRMGITVATLNSYVVQQGLLPNGAYVTEVEAGSPAEEAGIQKGDIIVDVDDTVITGSDMLIELLQGKYQDGDVIRVKVYRAENMQDAQTVGEIGEGEYIDLEVTLKVYGEQPAA